MVTTCNINIENDEYGPDRPTCHIVVYNYVLEINLITPW